MEDRLQSFAREDASVNNCPVTAATKPMFCKMFYVISNKLWLKIFLSPALSYYFYELPFSGKSFLSDSASTRYFRRAVVKLAMDWRYGWLCVWRYGFPFAQHCGEYHHKKHHSTAVRAPGVHGEEGHFLLSASSSQSVRFKIQAAGEKSPLGQPTDKCYLQYFYSSRFSHGCCLDFFFFFK